MFVKHCPDPGLASVFKYKRIHEWTTKEIQERIDEYRREQVSSTREKEHGAALFSNEARTESHTPCDNSLSSSACSPVVMPPLSPPPGLSQNRQQSFSPAPQTQQVHPSPLPRGEQHAPSPPPRVQRPSPAPQSQQPSGQQQGSDAMLSEMVVMLRELLTKVQVGGRRPPYRRGNRQYRNPGLPANETHCQVCNDENHATEAHCRSAFLCFSCFQPGHVRRSCGSRSSAHDNVQGN